MATDIVRYYPSDDIIAFPSSNSIDEGKLTLEENMRAIVTRITNRNYALTEDSFILTLIGTNKLQISEGNANIQGYDVLTSAVLDLEAPIMTGEKIIVGMKLTYDNSDHIRGDVEDGAYSSFEGVWVGYFPPGTKDKDMLILGTIDYDGSTITNVTRNPEITHRVDAGDISVTITGPKPPADVINLQEFIEKMKDWYVSRFGDFIYADGPVGDGVLGFKKKYADENYAASIDTGITDVDGGKFESLGIDSAGRTSVSMKSDRAGFAGNTYEMENSGLKSVTQIGFTNGTSNIFEITNLVSGTGSGSSSILFDSGAIDIKSIGNKVNLSAYASADPDSITQSILPNKIQFGSTQFVNGHIFGYDASGVSPYYSLGDLTISCVNHVTSLVSGASGGTDINIRPNILTEILKAEKGVNIGTNWNVKIDDSGFVQTDGTSAGTIINKIMGSTGFVTTKNFIATGNISNPSGASVIYSAINNNSLKFNNPTGTSTIYFNGANGNNVSLYHAYNSSILNLSGNFTASGDIRANRVYNAVYNDYAEWYEKDDINEVIEPGDVIEMNPSTGRFRKSTSKYSQTVVGVCSDSYGHILGGDKLEKMEDNNKKYIPIGISGRVKVKVYDRVSIGDILVADSNGHARKADSYIAGTVIGKALSNSSGGKVTMQIMLS